MIYNDDKVTDQDFLIIPVNNTDSKNKEHIYLLNSNEVFGFGGHETTSTIIHLLKNMDLTNKNILDVGTGTGILSICASKMGAKFINATDNDDTAINIVKQNLLLNNINNCNVYKCNFCTEELINKSDIILANLNVQWISSFLSYCDKWISNNQLIIMSYYKILHNFFEEELQKYHYQIKNFIKGKNSQYDIVVIQKDNKKD